MTTGIVKSIGKNQNHTVISEAGCNALIAVATTQTKVHTLITAIVADGVQDIKLNRHRMGDRTMTRLEQQIEILKSQQAESVRLLTACKSWVGTDLGEQIAQQLAAIKGQRHDAAAWNMADTNGEQGR